MRIAQLTIDYSPNGGVGSYIMALCPALEAAGHEVTVIHANPVDGPPALSAPRRFHVEAFDRFDAANEARRRAAEVMEILDDVHPDLVHIQANNNFSFETAIRERFPAVKSLHVYDFCPSGNKFHHALEKVCRHPTGPLCVPRMGYKRCLLSKRPRVILWHYLRCVEVNRNNAHYAKLIVASEYVKRQAVSSGYPPGQIETLPYFTEIEPLALEPNGVPEEGPGPAEGTILFAGRLAREKGLEHLLSALALVSTPSRLIVAGSGPDLARAKRLARTLNLEARTSFVGWTSTEQLGAFYRTASVVVLPSVWPEPFGIVGIEAMSHAKPVVAYNVGGIPEWLEDGVTGFLVTPYDVAEMAEKITYLLTHPDVAQQMGLQGRRRALKDFNKEQHVTRLLVIYREIIEGRVAAS